MTSVLERPAAEAGSVESGALDPNVLKAAGLYTALTDALHFVSPASAMVRPLEVVRLEAADGQLVAVAMDRFVVGASRVDYSGASFSVSIAASDAKALAAMAKTRKRDENWRDVTVEVAADGTTAAFRFNSGESMTVRGIDESFPKWRHLLPVNAERMGGTSGMGHDPARLAKFTKVRSGERGVAVVAFPTMTPDGRPGVTVIQVGDGFIGLLLPQRPPGDVWRYERPAWLDEAVSGPASAVEQVR